MYSFSQVTPFLIKFYSFRTIQQSQIIHRATGDFFDLWVLGVFELYRDLRLGLSTSLIFDLLFRTGLTKFYEFDILGRGWVLNDFMSKTSLNSLITSSSQIINHFRIVQTTAKLARRRKSLGSGSKDSGLFFRQSNYHQNFCSLTAREQKVVFFPRQNRKNWSVSLGQVRVRDCGQHLDSL